MFAPAMFGRFKKKANPHLDAMRELLFGDVSWSDWKAKAGGEPWSSFESARIALEDGDAAGAVSALRRVTSLPTLESRQYLQAWHFLRQLGVQPDASEAKRVWGVVLEVHLAEGLDTLAAYADHAARYLNHGGNVIVWEPS